MSGFLEKDKRLIDYKLTEFGRDKLSLGTFDLKYYTFSDSSIVYNEDLNTEKSFKVSSLNNFLPFEVDANVNNILNPEYSLSSIISFDQIDDNLLFTNKQSNRTLSDSLVELKYIDNKNLTSDYDNREINFDYLHENNGEFNFNKTSFSYPTIKYTSVNLANIDYIKNDKRFIDKTRNKVLPPRNSFKVENNQSNSSNIDHIFKSLSINQDLPDFTNKNDYIVNILNMIKSSDELFKLEYILNEDKMIDEDVFLFELHRLVNNESDTNKLEKLSFINIGEFYDKKEYNFKNVYLVGKVYLSSSIKEEINSNNKRYTYKINNDYSFVNMFTLVIE